MRLIIRTGVVALALLLARQTAYAEGYGRPAHVWVLWADSLHPVGIAWGTEWDGLSSSIEIWFGLGIGQPIKLTLPLVVLGPLTICVLAAVVYGLCICFNKSKHHDQRTNAA